MSDSAPSGPRGASAPGDGAAAHAAVVAAVAAPGGATAAAGPPGLTHVGADGAARMVDVGAKPITARFAEAEARVVMAEATLARVLSGGVAKGEVLQVARIAGIQGAKRTPDLIPLCHPLPLDAVECRFEPVGAHTLVVRCTARVTAKTGVEMEALTGAAVAALTVYDMVKAIDRGVRIEGLRLLRKSGGRSGAWTRDADANPADGPDAAHRGEP